MNEDAKDTVITEKDKSLLFYRCTICQGFLDSVDSLVAHWVIRHGITVTGQPQINKLHNNSITPAPAPTLPLLTPKLEDLDYESLGQLISPTTTTATAISNNFDSIQPKEEEDSGLLSFTSLVPVISLIKQEKGEGVGIGNQIQESHLQSQLTQISHSHGDKFILNNSINSSKILDDELRFLGQEITANIKSESESGIVSSSCVSNLNANVATLSVGVGAGAGAGVPGSVPVGVEIIEVDDRIEIDHFVSKLVEGGDNVNFLFESALLDEQKELFGQFSHHISSEQVEVGVGKTGGHVAQGQGQVSSAPAPASGGRGQGPGEKKKKQRKNPLRNRKIQKQSGARKMNLNLNQQHGNNAHAGYIDNRGWTPDTTLYLPLPSPSEMLSESPGAGESYCCPVCNIQFQTRSQLMGHTRKHMKDKLFQCKLCDQNFPTHKELKSHMADKNETDEFSITCGICQRTFPSQACLTHHLNCHKQAGSAPVIIDNPSAERRYSCSLCSKTFKNSQHVQRHLRIHTGEKPFSCMQCGQSFSLNHNLQRHMRTHTGEKPHKCPVCSKEFAEGHNLKRHMISAHDGPTPYICSICNRKFAENSILKKHQNKAHKNTNTNANTNSNSNNTQSQ